MTPTSIFAASPLDPRLFVATARENQQLADGMTVALLRLHATALELDSDILEFTKADLAAALNKSERTIERYLSLLVAETWIEHEARHRLHRVRLIHPDEREQLLEQTPSAATTPFRSQFDEAPEIKVRQNCRRSPTGLSEISDRAVGLLKAPSSTVKLTNHPPQCGGGDFEALAMEIFSEAPQPPGLSALPCTRFGVRHLVQRLSEGWPEIEARRLLAAAPAILRRGLRGPDGPEYYTPTGLFEGERHERWIRAFDRLREIEGREVAEARAADELAADPRPSTARRASTDAQRDEVARLLRDARDECFRGDDA